MSRSSQEEGIPLNPFDPTEVAEPIGRIFFGWMEDREDLAKLALERKNANMLQLQNLDKQIIDMQTQQDKLEQTEKRLSAKVEEFRSKKEVIKAEYTAQVRTKENLTGISEEMAM